MTKLDRTTHRYQEFIRKVVNDLDQPELPNTLTAEERVQSAVGLTDALMETDGELTDENAVKVAATIAALDQRGATNDADV